MINEHIGNAMDCSPESWAKSLLGRHWEIYWSDDRKCQKKAPGDDQKGGMAAEGIDIDATGIEQEDEVVDEEDWYDGHIEEIDSIENDGKYSFRLRFVGDDRLYTMGLEPKIVRPSALAWIKRSKAILGSHSQPSKKYVSYWEKSLPPDTRTIEDAQQLARLESQYGNYHFLTRGATFLSSDRKAQDMPDTAELEQIRRLATLLSTQLYLRSKLAPIVEQRGGPSETYVDYLLRCLRHLYEASQWYFRCWELHQKIFLGAPSLLEGRYTAISTRLDQNYAIREGLQEGRCVITHLLRLDMSLAGSKRRRPADTCPGGTRKTKRRRGNNSLVDFIKESERRRNMPRPQEDEFLSSDAVSNFVDQVQCNDCRWYTRHFGKMMQSISLNVVAPLLLWIYKVERMLGDRPKTEVESDQTDGETSEEDSDDDDNETTTESNKSEHRFYTFDEIKATEESGNEDPILRHFDLSRLQDRLALKLADIREFEKSCWSTLSQVFSAPATGVLLIQHENIYSELERLKMSVVSAKSSLSNVSPLGCSSSLLSRKVLDDALALRRWYLDLHRVESSRERLVFIDKMAKRASELPRLPQCEHTASLDDLLNTALSRLRRISQGYFDHLTRFNKCRSILLSRSNPSNNKGVDFATIEGVSSALHALAEIQVLSLSEEMLCVRLDVLRWKSDAHNLLEKPKISFDELVELQRSLDAVQKGISPTRARALESIEADDQVNAEVRAFAEDDVTAFCGSLVSLVNAKYAITCAWKERSDAVMSAIKQHSSQQSSVQKPPPMVDLKRVSGLISDYKISGIFLPHDLSVLHTARETAKRWSLELTAFLFDGKKSFAELLLRLQCSRMERPKGIIVDPARHTVDNLVDLLAWQQEAIEAMNGTRCRNVEANEYAASKSTPSISRCAYTLIAEGSEILEVLGRRDTICFAVVSAFAVDLMFRERESRRSIRVISRTKLESNALGRDWLDRIIRKDAQEGSPLRFLLLILWHASVDAFLDKYDCTKGTNDAVTLQSGKDLVSRRPIPVPIDEVNVDLRDSAFGPSLRENALMELIAAGENIEDETLRLLVTSKELFRGPWRRMNSIQTLLAMVKGIHNRYKVPLAPNGSGLVLSKTLEQQLDHVVRAFTWLVRTFPPPFLHQVVCKPKSENRIPWEILVSLNERKPSGLHSMGDCARIKLRVAEIFEAASVWQAEITKVTSLSYRGGKRRGEETEGGAQPIVNVEQVRRLVKDPVLRKVAMPRESAASEILESAKTFEVLLHRFLSKDFDDIGADAWQDRAPYPDHWSLLGRSGEFLLYRLTGSPLYSALISSIEHISSMAQDVLADTPGKVAFEWIRHAVCWIDSFRTSVTRQCYATGGIERLAFTESDARSIVDDGKSFFLDTPEDLKKTMSAHRIFMSTNKVQEKLKVVFKKGGAHHSVGGTAIKWCPILFDSLREDLSRLDSWKSQVVKVQSTFQEFSSERNGALINLETDVLGLASFHEELAMLLEEGIESLVVNPPEDILDTMIELDEELQVHLEGLLGEHSSMKLDERVTTRRFEDLALVLRDRFNLLDTLLTRSLLELEISDQRDHSSTFYASSTDQSFRDSWRTAIQDALQSAAWMIGLHQADPAIPDSAFYAMKAGEIEHEIYSRFHLVSNATMLSFDYKDKARTLGFVLGYCINPQLCIQVLLGQIDSVEFVTLQERELIGEWKARSDPSSNNTLVTELTVGEKEGVLGQVDSMDSEYESCLNTTVGYCGNPGEYEHVPASQPEQASASAAPFMDRKPLSHYEMTAQGLDIVPSLICNLSTPGTADRIPAQRPHAPPSLAASLIAHSPVRSHHLKGANTKVSRRGKYLLNSSAHDSFLLAVSKPFKKFKCRFSIESDPQRVRNGSLPECLSERGRLRVDEFLKFLSGKLKGGKWTAGLLRMSISSDEDAKNHKKFYKEYESVERIAMFAVSDDCKLFLVTPKFHRAAAKALGTSFHVVTSSYVVALTRVTLEEC